MNTKEKEAQILDIQLIATLLYIGSLIISYALTYNDKQSVLGQKTIFTEKQSRDFSIFNRTFVVILTLLFLYINYENRKLAKEKGQKLENFNLQIIAGELSALATIIVLYVVIKTAGDQYSIVPGIGNPSL